MIWMKPGVVMMMMINNLGEERRWSNKGDANNQIDKKDEMASKLDRMIITLL